jgi:protein nanos 1
MNNFQEQPSSNLNLDMPQLIQTGPYSPLTIHPVDNLSIDCSNNSSTNSLWSPFSTPSFSPYSVNDSSPTHRSTFQYSRPLFFSPNPLVSYRQHAANNNYYNNCIRRPITSTLNPNSKVFQPRTNQQQQQQLQQQQQYIQQHYSKPVTLNGLSNDENSISSPFENQYQLPKRSQCVDMSEYIEQARLHRMMGGRPKMCSFCKSNGESQVIYTSHTLKDSTDKIICPILKMYTCPICGATGEAVHTKKYCPLLQKRVRIEMLNKLTARSNENN